ncbi:ABC transporter [Mycolicibacter heraklionensis]|nr:ABC transporter [Mycolicibacter heraklionensis]
MSVAISTAVTGADFDAVAEKTREILKDNGFGVLTEIDMQATLKAKLGEDMERYLILGACNPPLAHRAVTAEKRIGVLLPCNIVVREDTEHPGTVLVEAMNPELMAQVLDNPAVAPIADEVSEKIRTVIDTLAGALRTT